MLWVVPGQSMEYLEHYAKYYDAILSEDYSIDCDIQSDIILGVSILMVCCPCYCCIWCCCKMRRVKGGKVVVRRLNAGQAKESKLKAKFEIIDDKQVPTMLSNPSPDTEQTSANDG